MGKPKREIKDRCSYCHCYFTAERSSRRYCTAACRRADWEKKFGEDSVDPMRVIGRTQLHEDAICRQCGAQFKPTNPKQLFCNAKCRWKSWDARNPRVGVGKPTCDSPPASPIG